MEKLCRRCDTVKPITEFRKDSHKKTGYGSCCKPCSSQQAKEYRRANPEKVKAFEAQWYLANKGRKQARDAKRLAPYRDRKRELDRARYASGDPEVRRAQWNRWYLANREHSLRYKQVQRIIRRSQGADWKAFPESLTYVRLVGSDPCVYCGARSAAIDHIRPVSKGGSGQWDNLAPSCMSCNSSKCDEELLSFLLRRNKTIAS